MRKFVGLIVLSFTFYSQGELTLPSNTKGHLKSNEQDASTTPISKKLVAQKAPRKRTRLSCDEQWARWLKEHAAGSPLASLRKAMPKHWRISKANVKKLLNNQAPDLSSLAKRTNRTEDSAKFIWKSFIETKNLGVEEKLRFHLIRDHIEFQRKYKKKNELLIVHTGGAHAVDYFANYLGQKVIYTSPRIDDRSKRHGPNYLKAEGLYLDATIRAEELMPRSFSGVDVLNFYKQQKQRRLKDMEWGKNNSMAMALFPYAYLGKKANISMDAVLSEKTDANNKVIVVTDINHIRSTKFIEDLPTAKCLRELGIDQITFLDEGMHRIPGGRSIIGHSNFISKDAKSTALKNLELQRANLKFGLGVLKRNNKDTDDMNSAIELLEKTIAALKDMSFHDFTPVRNALLRKLSEYQRRGIDVQYQGLDIPLKGNQARRLLYWASTLRSLKKVRNQPERKRQEHFLQLAKEAFEKEKK